MIVRFPMVSIIMATYNRSKFILEALHSIQEQTHSNWECIIVDDGGTDNTKEVIADILTKDLRFKFFKRPDKYLKGLPGARNYGLDLAKGDYVIFFDDDDFVHPNNLEYGLKAIGETQTDFCHYQKQSFENKLPQVKTEDLKIYNTITKDDIEDIINGNHSLASCTVLWKKKCFETIRFNETLMYAEEWECYTRVMLNGVEGISLNNILYYNRKHVASNTGQFWKNDSVKVGSKKKALILIVSNLEKAGMLSPNIFNYLVNLAISFRDFNLLKTIFRISNFAVKTEIFYKSKFVLYPIWVFIKKWNKK